MRVLGGEVPFANVGIVNTAITVVIERPEWIEPRLAQRLSHVGMTQRETPGPPGSLRKGEYRVGKALRYFPWEDPVTPSLDLRVE